MIAGTQSRPKLLGTAVSRRTGPLALLRGKQVLVVADGQNLEHGAADLGRELKWHTLRHRLEAASERAWFHAVFAAGPGDRRKADYLARQGWTPSAKTRKQFFRLGRKQIDANADNLVAFQVGAVMSRLPVDVVVIGSGDGQLAEDLAEAVCMMDSRCEVVTLSLAGSTAARLDARFSPVISANIEIGEDCLYPIHKSIFVPLRGRR